MPQRVTRPVLVPLSCVLLVLGGCLGTPPSRFYLLPTLTDVSSPAAMGERALTIGVGPVTLPPYLDRPQIVTRASRAQLHLAELDQWAASLQDTVARVLAENLSLLIPTAWVVLHPWPRTTVIDRQILLEVTRFDRTMGGEAVLVARWSLLGAAGQELAMRKAHFSAPAGGPDYEATVTAMGRTPEALSHDIAATVQDLAH
ncbi:MAG TPA: PqiC family protein [Candidatus Tectomicrobia bacterium]